MTFEMRLVRGWSQVSGLSIHLIPMDHLQHTNTRVTSHNSITPATDTLQNSMEGFMLTCSLQIGCKINALDMNISLMRAPETFYLLGTSEDTTKHESKS
jgi:hypothetical protein